MFCSAREQEVEGGLTLKQGKRLKTRFLVEGIMRELSWGEERRGAQTEGRKKKRKRKKTIFDPMAGGGVGTLWSVTWVPDCRPQRASGWRGGEVRGG